MGWHLTTVKLIQKQTGGSSSKISLEAATLGAVTTLSWRLFQTATTLEERKENEASP